MNYNSFVTRPNLNYNSNYNMSLNFTPIIGIRREDKNVWERRTPLVPQDCYKLIQEGIRIIVQPCNIRCYSNEEYKQVGCEISEDLSPCTFIVAVKEVPERYLMANKTYLFFSHTIKGQRSNMPMLKTILDRKIRLFDYECLKDESGISKGSSLFAGIVGAIDFLHGIGKLLLYKKIMTPFLLSGYAYMFPSLENVKQSLKRMRELITNKLLPVEICPFIIGITSKGTASQGVQEILNVLPHEYIDPEKVGDLVEESKKDPSKLKRDRIYITVILQQHMYKRKEGYINYGNFNQNYNQNPSLINQKQNFDKNDLYQNPQNYYSIFAENFIPYLSALFNCIYWDQKFPKLLSLEEARTLSKDNRFRLMGVSDITCDIDGSIALMQKVTTVEKPFYCIDPLTNRIEEEFDRITERSILYHAVDHLPCELPGDASNLFSAKLLIDLRKIAFSPYPYTNYQMNMHPDIYQGCISENGRLTDKYSYIYSSLSELFPVFKEEIREHELTKKVITQ
jgi:alpha-aminoadipic semialdehyde synthase